MMDSAEDPMMRIVQSAAASAEMVAVIPGHGTCCSHSVVITAPAIVEPPRAMRGRRSGRGR